MCQMALANLMLFQIYLFMTLTQSCNLKMCLFSSQVKSGYENSTNSNEMSEKFIQVACSPCKLDPEQINYNLETGRWNPKTNPEGNELCAALPQGRTTYHGKFNAWKLKNSS